MPVHVEASDLLTVGLLVILEGLLSADNALVLAILVLGLPREEQKRALRYGILGAFTFRIIAILLATYLMQVSWVRLAGGAYLLYLSYAHFFRRGDEHGSRHAPPVARAAFGLSAFWATVVRVEFVDIAFSVDSILVAVALSDKLWVIVLGGILGIVAMRLVAGQLIQLIRTYPALVDGAFIIIAWVGVKLLLEYANAVHWIDWEIPKTISMGLIVVIFIVAFLFARKQGARPDASVDSPEVK